MSFKDASECAYEQKGAERVALSNSFIQRVADDVVHGEGSGRISGKMNTRRGVIKEAEP